MNNKIPFDIHVISMKESVRRSRFVNFEYDYSFFDAYTEGTDFDQNKAKEKYGRELRKGEVGCTTSHMELYKHLHNNSLYNWHLILEDDAKLEPEFKSLYDNFNNELLSDIPMIIILGHSKTIKKYQLIQKLKQPMKIEFNIGPNKFGRKNISFIGTVCYLINNSALAILQREVPFWVADDWDIINSFGINVYHIRDNLIYEEFDNISSTGNLRIVDHDISKYPIKNIVKILLNQVFYLIGNKKRYS